MTGEEEPQVFKEITFKGEFPDLTLKEINYCREGCKHDYITMELSVQVKIETGMEIIKEIAHGDYDFVEAKLKFVGDKRWNVECIVCDRGSDILVNVFNDVYICSSCLDKIGNKVNWRQSILEDKEI